MLEIMRRTMEAIGQMSRPWAKVKLRERAKCSNEDASHVVETTMHPTAPEEAEEE